LLAPHTSSTENGIIDYVDSLGLFENIHFKLPPGFEIIFRIARNILSDESSEFCKTLKELSKEDIKDAEKQEIVENYVYRTAPLSDNMVIDTYKNINDLKKALSRELAFDDDIFNIKLFTKSLLIQNFYTSESDVFKSISTKDDGSEKEANTFEQKVYILLDCSKSMETRGRTFYSKCLVAEFLRQKVNTKAKLYFRTFDSKPGPLVKINSPNDFHFVIEKVLLSMTGGSGTHIQKAILQALSDMKYDKEMLNSEILVVTDGASKIDKVELKKQLGDVKLNIVKIGDEIAQVDYFELKNVFEENNIKVDPNAINVKLHNSMKETLDRETMDSQKGARLIRGASNAIFKDLKEASNLFIEIPDLDINSISQITDESEIANLEEILESLKAIPLNSLNSEEKLRLYQQVYFLKQYLESLMQHSGEFFDRIKNLEQEIDNFKHDLLNDAELADAVMKSDAFDKDKKFVKLANKKAKKDLLLKTFGDRKLTKQELRDAALTMTSGAGSGGIGDLIMILWYKFTDKLKSYLSSIFKSSENNKK
jgi:hypothetical protein